MKPNKNNHVNGLDVALGIFFLLYIAHFISRKPWALDSFEKKWFCHFYGIDKKTLGKWVRLFCRDVILPVQYNRYRKIPLEIAVPILLCLGLPDGNGQVLTKREIIVHAAGSYRSLRECVARFPNGFGLSQEAFRSLHVFPPLISQQILEQYG